MYIVFEMPECAQFRQTPRFQGYHTVRRHVISKVSTIEVRDVVPLLPHPDVHSVRTILSSEISEIQ